MQWEWVFSPFLFVSLLAVRFADPLSRCVYGASKFDGAAPQRYYFLSLAVWTMWIAVVKPDDAHTEILRVRQVNIPPIFAGLLVEAERQCGKALQQSNGRQHHVSKSIRKI